ncbi:site-specific integrase [Gordonia sp. PP30]|uniref:tyrosine-type recombinase/integrase n=1 Tax=Gordonia sp. PP30 TaxID=2935861 RepID=UPI001FFF9C84|nr:site-specific integrase [Gordonia sp. PP30]UQE74244.1 site-specific integrase [Gordonia sp. PP30]
MASVQAREHSDGTTTWRVRWRQDGRDRSLTFVDAVSAESFKRNVDLYGPAEAFRIIDLIDDGLAQITLAQWCTGHIDTLTGVEDGTRDRYRAYVTNDIADLGAMPLAAVTDTVVARWVNGLAGSGKTIANKHGFLAGALNHAVRAGKITKNPCDHTRLPRKDGNEMCFLTRSEFDLLHDAMTPRWQPLTRWLVATGMRFGEATALTVADINAADGTARVSKAWKYTGSHVDRRLGTTKTKKGQRTINVPASVIALVDLDRPGEALAFPTRTGGPVSHQLYRNRAWLPALTKASAAREDGDQTPRLTKTPRVHDLRHTCASWMIQAGIPLPVIQQHLGHESITTTIGTYGHLDRTSAKAAADAIGKILA